MTEICEEFMTCRICKEVPNSAKLLTCLHSFCLSCLYKKIDTISNNSGEIRCPRCDSATQLPARGVVALRDNVFLERLVRSGRYESFMDCFKRAECSESTKLTADKDLNIDCKTEVQNGCSDSLKCSENDLKTAEKDQTGPVNDVINCQQCGVNAGAQSRGDAGNVLEDDVSKSKECNTASYHCNPCDIYLCESCKDQQHNNHEVLNISTAKDNKQNYLDQLMADMTELTDKYKLMELQVTNALHHLQATTKSVVNEIETRAELICNFIQHRKTNLVNQVTKLWKEWEAKYSQQEKTIQKCQNELQGVLLYTNMVLNNGSDQDIIDMTADLAERLHHLSKNSPVSSDSTNGAKKSKLNVAVMNLKLDILEWAKDDLIWDKAFGMVVFGIIHCGSAEVARTFDIDLTWPTGMVETKDHDFVVVGKTGALEQHGKIMFYNRQGKLLVDHDLGKSVPFDTVSLPNGDILVSDSSGQMNVLSPYGEIKETMASKFKGTGRMAVNECGQILVTSSDEKKILIYDATGRFKDSFPGPWASDVHGGLAHPHYIATNLHNECVVSDFKLNSIFLFDSNGDLVMTYKGTDLPSGQLKCASAVCCDNYDNILVADFMSDCVHLVSRNGTFLGYLVTKDNDISCPNFMTVDNDGHLFIGQYGGHITVFQYMNYMRLV